MTLGKFLICVQMVATRGNPNSPHARSHDLGFSLVCPMHVVDQFFMVGHMGDGTKKNP